MKKIITVLFVLFLINSHFITGQNALNPGDFKTPPQTTKVNIWWR